MCRAMMTRVVRHSSTVTRAGVFITARNEVGARLYFYRRLWFCPRGGSTWPGTPPRPGTTPGTRYTPPGPGTSPLPWDQVHPLPQDQVQPPGPGTPLGPGTSPRTRYTPWDQVHPPGIRSPGAEHAGRYGQRAGGTHPTGMQSCSRMYKKQLNLRGCLVITEWRALWAIAYMGNGIQCIWMSWCQRHCTTPGPMPGSVTTAVYYRRRVIEKFRTETKKRETDPRLDNNKTLEAVANPTTHPIIWPPSIGEQVADLKTPHNLHGRAQRRGGWPHHNTT